LKSSEHRQHSAKTGQISPVDAWLVMANAVENPGHAQQCLERVLQLDPENFEARIRLDGLLGATAAPEIQISKPQLQVDVPLYADEPIPGESTLVTQHPPETSEQLPVQPHPQRVTQARPRSVPAKKARSSPRWLEIGLIGIIVVCALCVGSILLIDPTIIQPDPTPSAEEITNVIYENIRASNNENLAAYMATIHTNSPYYDTTEEMLQTVFGDYDLSYFVSYVEVIELSNREAVVSFVLTTRRIRGGPFSDNRVTGEWTLRPEDGVWKIYDQKVSDVEYLD
jgi:hypothetical protein